MKEKVKIQIKKGVEIPEWHSTVHRTTVYPWDEMKVGDSFTIEGYTKKKASYYGTLGESWMKRNNPRFRIATRRLEDKLIVFMVERKFENELKKINPLP